MNIYNEFLKSIFYAYVYYLRVLEFLGLYTFKIQYTITDKEHDFFNKKREWFIEKTAKIGNQTNENINPLFYNKILYNEYLNTTNKQTQLEKKWKTRLSFISTPRGNVIMYYDAYKLGFAYYSDQSKLSNEILNACAMQYAVQYRCLDFYVDEATSPNFKENRFVKTVFDEETEADKIIKKPTGFLVTNKKQQQDKNTKEKNIEPPKMKNKYIYVGKLSTIYLLKQPEKPNKNILFKSDLLNMLEENADVQKNVFSYADYKKLKGE